MSRSKKAASARLRVASAPEVKALPAALRRELRRGATVIYLEYTASLSKKAARDTIPAIIEQMKLKYSELDIHFIPTP